MEGYSEERVCEGRNLLFIHRLDAQTQGTVWYMVALNKYWTKGWKLIFSKIVAVTQKIDGICVTGRSNNIYWLMDLNLKAKKESFLFLEGHI